MPRAAAIDGPAMTLSGLCLLHCLALPLLSTTLPMVGVWAEAEWLHKAFVVTALPFSFWALAMRGQSWAVHGLIIVGFGLLASSAFVEPWHDYELPLTVLGAIILASGHALRWRQSHNASH